MITFGLSAIYFSLILCTYFASRKGAKKAPEIPVKSNDRKPINIIIEQEKALEDLECLKNIINAHHPATMPLFGSNKDELIDKVKAQITGDISKENFYFFIQSILSSFKDAHTTANAYVSLRNYKTTKVKYLWLNDGLYIGEDIESLIKGDKILSINEKSVDNILSELSLIVSNENLNRVRSKATELLNMESYLKYLSIKDEHNTLNFEIIRDGQEENEIIAFKDLAGEIPFEYNSDFYFSLIENNKLGFFQINTCLNNVEYQIFLQNAFISIKEHNIKNIIIDLRKNEGGDPSVIDEFLSYLDVDTYKGFVKIKKTPKEEDTQLIFSSKEDYLKAIESHTYSVTHNIEKELIFKGKIYILTSKATFGSANMFGTIFQDNNFATIVGEPTGKAPTGYGDKFDFILPNCKIPFSMSQKILARPDLNKEATFLQPDIVVETKIEDILNDIDPQLEKIKELMRNGNS